MNFNMFVTSFVDEKTSKQKNNSKIEKRLGKVTTKSLAQMKESV